jgi:hypothetical protein
VSNDQAYPERLPTVSETQEGMRDPLQVVKPIDGFV